MYYGKTPNNSDKYAKANDPILFRVLNTKANGKANASDAENTDALLLLSEYDIYSANQKWDDTEPYGQTWETDSSIRKMLNNEGGTLYDCFSAQERTTIMETTNGETKENDKINWVNTISYAYGCGLTGDKLFLLSAKEAVNQDYGFAAKGNLYQSEGGVNDINRIAKRGDAAGRSIAWWLRSASSYRSNRVVIVGSNGMAYGFNTDSTEIGVRFALNIPLSSIVYTSDASEGNSTTSSLAPINAKAKSSVICAQSIAPSEATILAGASKLTILDDSRSSFKVTQESATAKAGAKLTLDYTGAQTTSNEYISIIIKNSEGEGLYYGTPKAVTEADGSVTFNVPEDLPAGNYTLEVLNEQKNAAKETNYAGEPCQVALSVSVVPPRKAVLTATEEEGGAGLWKVVATPSADARALATFTGEGKTQTIEFDVPYYEPAITQVYVVDYAENVSDPISLTIDSSSPTKTVSYKNGAITVTVTDTEAGILSVDGEEKQPTTDEKGYPTKATVNVTDKNKASVNVVDALGNDTTVDIDRSAPSITKAYKNGNKAIIKATDTGEAGLWKAVSSNSVDGELVCPFEGKPNEQEKVFTIEGTAPAEVYAIDHAGNISATAVELADDITPPSGYARYDKGRITLKVSDNQSGIAQIEETPYHAYPTTVNDYNVTTGTASVNVVDALGNTGTIAIDNTAPEATEAFISGGNVTITATDTDSGMWKVVDESDNVLYTYNTGDPKTVRFTTANTSLAKVCLVDKAGNKSAAIELKVDNTAPEVTRAFIKADGEKGKVIITATDTDSGMWKVVDESNNVLYTYNEGDPETVRFSVANSSLPKVFVVDKAGNQKEVSLQSDTTAPTGTRGFVDQAQN